MQAKLLELAQEITSQLASDCEADALLPEVENDLTAAVEKIFSEFATSDVCTNDPFVNGPCVDAQCPCNR